MNSLTDLITLALALSVAVERVMEILKGLIPALAQQQSNLKLEYLRGAILHLISVLIGALAAYAGNINFLQRFSSGPSNPWVGYLVCGLLAAGGSAFWNHVLDIVKALKIKDESAASEAAKGAGNNNPIPA